MKSKPIKKTNLSFRVNAKTYELARGRAKACNTTISNYLETMIDGFSGTGALEYQERIERRDALREELKQLLSEISGLELVIERAEIDRDRLRAIGE